MQWLLATAFVLCFPAFALAGTREDGQAVFEAFIAEFNSANADNVAKLFTADALFWGTRAPDLITTSEGVHQYFANAFKTRPGAKASIVGQPSAVALTDDVVVVSGVWQVAVEIDGKPTTIPLRNSLTIVKQGEKWRIAAFHNSPRPVP